MSRGGYRCRAYKKPYLFLNIRVHSVFNPWLISLGLALWTVIIDFTSVHKF